MSAGSVRPKGWLPWVGEEPPRSHILNESGRSTLNVGGQGLSITSLTQIQLHSTAVTREVWCLGQTRQAGWGSGTEAVPGPRGWLHLDPRGL